MFLDCHVLPISAHPVIPVTSDECFWSLLVFSYFLFVLRCSVCFFYADCALHLPLQYCSLHFEPFFSVLSVFLNFSSVSCWCICCAPASACKQLTCVHNMAEYLCDDDVPVVLHISSFFSRIPIVVKRCPWTLPGIAFHGRPRKLLP